MADWMAMLLDPLTKVPLQHLAIPGSHDSGATAELSARYPVANDEKNNRFLNCFGRFSLNRRYIKRWAITQRLSPKQQCEAGVRYFDLRISKPDPNGPSGLRIVHGLYGAELEEFLTQIKEFLDEHKKEVVILDINHLFEVNDVSHALIEDTIIRIFGWGKCCRQQFDSLPTLQKLWKRDQQLICLSCHDNLPLGSLFWTVDSSIMSPYPNTNKVSTLLNFINVMQQQVRPVYPDRFYVTQGVLTARTSDIIKNPFSTLELTLSLRATDAIQQWIALLDEVDLINIVMVDFVDAEFCRKIIHLNYKKIKHFRAIAGPEFSVNHHSLKTYCTQSDSKPPSQVSSPFRTPSAVSRPRSYLAC